ncbi:hypothetical protein MKEN_00141000 [Mycena kentingensis (nom. inval.)]|nr:hypothetical protein MKEN_00141000 [Mycena kentingensis (nom. inval.)]
MASRRAANTTSSRIRKTESIKSSGGDDFDFLAASQGSAGSDDQAFQLAVAQQLMASKEKKQREKEAKFLQAAKKKLTNELTAVAESIQNAQAVPEEHHARFYIDYAVSEDNIRALWIEIRKEVERLDALALKYIQTHIAARAATENAHIAGMGSVREACQEWRPLIHSLLPSDS